MAPTDTLSCWDDVDTTQDNIDVQLLPSDTFNQQLWAINVALVYKIKDSSTGNILVLQGIHQMEKELPLFNRSRAEDWTFNDRWLYYKTCLYIPKPALLSKNYWQPSLSTYVWKYISGCVVCQAYKFLTHSTVPTITPLIFEGSCLFQNLSINLITNLPPVNGLDSVMVMVDHGLSKGVILAPCTKTVDTAGIAQLFFKHIFKQFELHKKVMSDWGPQFTLAFSRELARLLQYDIALSSAYHSQTDGEMECYNQELKTYLCIFCKGQLQKWLELLLMAEFAHNTAVYLVTGKSPFSLMMGCKLQSYPPLERPFFQLLSSDSTKLRMYGRKLKLHTN